MTSLQGWGGWATTALVIVALIKAWPALAQQAIDARARMRQEKRTDLDDCKVRLDAMSDRLDASEEKQHALELKLVGAIGAYRILDAEVQIIAPESNALTQARALLSLSFKISPSTEERAPPPSRND